MRKSAGVVVLLLSGAVGAEPMLGPRAAVVDPVAVRGGVLVVPLTAQRPGDGWPRTLELRLADGRVLEGVVAWVHPETPGRPRHWTIDPRGLAVRAIRPEDDSSDPRRGAPHLLAGLPSDGRGTLTLGEQTLEPRWRFPAPAMTAATPPRLSLTEGPDLPDPESPFEYWRWVLLAEQLGRIPPASRDYGRIGAMLAEHNAALWRMALARLRRLDPELSTRCRELLTATSADGRQPLAVWTADPAALGALLGPLLDSGRSDDQVLAGASIWAEERGLLLIRTAPRAAGRVTIALATPGRDAVFVRFKWVGSADIAMSAVARPGRLVWADILRAPAPRTPAREAAGLRVMRIEAGGRLEQMVFGSESLVAEPPGVNFPALRPPLTLADVETRRQRPIAGDRATLVQVRKLDGRWEIFFECRRPPAPAPPGGGNLAAAASSADTYGVEAVSVLLGPDPPFVELTVPETGRHRLFRGRDDGTLEIHRRSYEDRWHCRIVVPELWLAVEPGRALVGFLRTHGDSEAIETGPYASLPWRIAPGRAAIITTEWDALPVRTDAD